MKELKESKTEMLNLILEGQEIKTKYVEMKYMYDRNTLTKEMHLLKEELAQKQNANVLLHEEIQDMNKNGSATQELNDKDELILKLKVNLKKRGLLLKDNQTNVDNNMINRLNEKLQTQGVIITDKERIIDELQDKITCVREDNFTISEINKKMNIELKHEIQELKEISADVISLVNFKQNLVGQDFLKQEEGKHQHNLKEKDPKLAEDIEKENLIQKIDILNKELTETNKENLCLLEENQRLSKNGSTLLDLQNKDELITRLKIDLKKRGVLLKDARAYVDLLQPQNNINKTLKKLTNQTDNLESEKNTILRQKKNVEYDLEEVKTTLDDINNKYQDLEKKHKQATQENLSLFYKSLENEEEMAEVMKKYQNSVASITSDQITLQAQSSSLIEYKKEITVLKEANDNLINKIEELEATKDTSDHVNKFKLKVSELEHKVELEKTTRNRMEIQIGRLRETVEKIDKEAEELRLTVQGDKENVRKLHSKLRDLKEDYIALHRKEVNMSQLKIVLDNKLLIAESENRLLKKELEMAHSRIDDFLMAIHSEICSETDTVRGSGEVDEEKASTLVKADKTISDSVTKAFTKNKVNDP